MAHKPKARQRMSLTADITENVIRIREMHPDWPEEKVLRAAIAAANREGGGGAPIPPGFRADSSSARGFRRA